MPVRATPGASGDARPRLLVLTDISSLTSGVKEPDDGQSMIRLMLYANDLDIEGLVASSNMSHGHVVRPDLIRRVIDGYAQVQPNLLLHSRDYPSADHLSTLVMAGQPIAGRDLPVGESIGDGKDTDASAWIIAAVDRPDPRPLWITAWGGTADLAQALWKVRRTRSVAEAERFVARLRVHAIGDQDSTGPWLKESFPDLFYITNSRSMRGMYRGGDTSLVSHRWVETHIRHGHGALGALYPNYNGGDPWTPRGSRLRGIKEGDTPSYLGLIPNGLSDPERPAWGGWGGRFEPAAGGPAHHYHDAVDEYGDRAADVSPATSAVYRWRSALQADFQARLDWCVQPYEGANHPPSACVTGGLRRTVAPGTRVILDARGSRDPDGGRLSYEWYLYREPGTYTGPLEIIDAQSPVASFRAPQVSRQESVHVVLTVQDDGSPPLCSYRRVVVTIDPSR